MKSLLIASLLISLSVVQSKHRSLSDRKAECEQKRCCHFRTDERENAILDNVRCESFGVSDCVSNDEVCVWNCEGNGEKASHFVKFDEGNGRTRRMRSGGNPPNQARPKAQNIEEMKRYSSVLTYGECGEVYETEISDREAQRILEYGPQKNVHNNMSESLDEDVDGHSQRRLGFTFGSDGRSRVYATSFPYKAAVLLHMDDDDGDIFDDVTMCSGVMISDKTVLTAAHCCYDTENNQWVSDMEALPSVDGWEDLFFPDWYDYSSMSILNTYVNHDNYDRVADICVIRLKESPSVGQMDFGYDTSLVAPKSFNTFGYPGDKGGDELWYQYCEYNKFDDDAFYSQDCDVSSGQSGSPIYIYYPSSDTRTIHAVLSGSVEYADGSQFNAVSRIDAISFGFICDFLAEGGEPFVDSCGVPQDWNIIGHSLYNGDALYINDALRSTNGRYYAIMQFDGNFVVYDSESGNGKAKWSAGTHSNGGYVIQFQGDNNLVVRSESSSAIWASGSTNKDLGANSRLHMQTDGNLVIYGHSGAALWALW